MGLKYYAYSIIGVKVDVSQPARKLVVPSCEHAQRIGNDYCPVCGKRVEDKTIEDSADDEQKFFDKITVGIPKEWIVTDYWEFEDSYIYIGVGIGKGAFGIAHTDLPDTAAVKHKLEESLGTEIWNKCSSTFGLHLICWAR